MCVCVLYGTITVRDESFITSWGGAVIFRGGGQNFFCDVPGGVEKKMTYGQGGSCISSGIGGGIRRVPLVFLFIKSHSFWGANPL